MNVVQYYTAVGAILKSPFGMRKHPIYGDMRMHNGIDFGGKPTGYPWPCFAPGTVTHRGEHGARGKLVVIRNRDLYLGVRLKQIYQHLDGYIAKVGDEVVQDSPIGANGMTGDCTGPHLHYELRIDDGSTLGSPVWGDPANFVLGGDGLKEYTVKSGDTLGGIASKNGISPWKKLVEWNQDRYPDIGTGSTALVRVGWVLRLYDPKLDPEPDPKPEPEYSLDKLIVYHSEADWGAASLLEYKLKSPAILYAYATPEMLNSFKIVVQVGGPMINCKAEVVHLAGADRIATAWAVLDYIDGL